MPTLLEILQDPNYINANPATKKAIFDKYAPQDSNYVDANDATKAAIRQRFGLSTAAPAAKKEYGVPLEVPPEDQQMLLEYIDDNQKKFHTLSLRTVVKLSKLYNLDPVDWKTMAELSLMKA